MSLPHSVPSSYQVLHLFSTGVLSDFDLPCSSFLMECFQLCSSSLYSFFQFVQPLKVLGFTRLSKKQLYFTSSSSVSPQCHPRSQEEILSQWWSVVMPRDRCARCLRVFRCLCHVICLRVAFCHVIMCIASSCFSKLASVRVPQFRPLSILSPDTLARARGTSEIVFYKWPENVLVMG